MKKFARPIALLAGLTLLVGCETLTQNWLPIASNHRPEAKTGTVKGLVVDGAGNPLPNALVTNRATVTFSDENGRFTLSKLNAGMQYITASYDGVKSLPVEIEVIDGQEKPISRIVVAASRPVSEGLAAVRLVGIDPGTLMASFSFQASDSADPDDSYTPAAYPTTKQDVDLLLASPPNGAGAIIRSYRIEYDDAGLPPIPQDFPSDISVPPGNPTQSGPARLVPIRNVGFRTSAFSRAIDTSPRRALTATITLYADAASTQQEPISLHAPMSGNGDATRSFQARVTLERAAE